MPWLWFAGPFVVMLIYLSMSVWPTEEEKRIHRELLRWLDEYLGPLRVGKKVKSRRVRNLPRELAPLVEEAGGGVRVSDVVLVPGCAYLAARAANGLTSTNQFTIVCTLDKVAPQFTCRPLPVVEGRATENRGILFPDDSAFSSAFIVDGAQSKVITKWLSTPVREALLELPEAFLRAQGQTMALTVYGSIDAD